MALGMYDPCTLGAGTCEQPRLDVREETHWKRQAIGVPNPSSPLRIKSNKSSLV